LCSTKILISDPRKPERELLTSMNMYFNDSGGENGGDICNIFNFDEDDDVVCRMQSEWDKDTSTTAKKRKCKAFLTDGDLSVHFSDKLKAIACCPRKDCSCLSMLLDPDMCSALVRYLDLFE
jgi:hypothetical protein